MRRLAVPATCIAMLLALASIGMWHFAQRELRHYTDETLHTIASLLDENQKIAASLIADGSTESQANILDSYLARLRKDGAARNSALKQRIDTLVNNDTVIVALLDGYAAHARTPAFKAAAVQYRDYALRFRDRWQSLFEIFMAGGNLPAAGPQYPTQLAVAINQELR